MFFVRMFPERHYFASKAFESNSESVEIYSCILVIQQITKTRFIGDTTNVSVWPYRPALPLCFISEKNGIAFKHFIYCVQCKMGLFGQ